MNWQEFQAEVMRRRECGEVIAAEMIWETPPTEQMVLQWLKDVGFSEAENIPPNKVTAEEAEGILIDLLSLDMAYQGPVCTIYTASEISDQYFSALVPDAELFINRRHMNFRGQQQQERSWLPTSLMTQAAFDAGVISLHPTQTTVFWFLDED